MVVVMVAVVARSTAAHAGPINCWLDGGTIVYSDQPPPEGAVMSEMPGLEPLPVVRAPDAPTAEATGNAAAAGAAAAQAGAAVTPQSVVVSATPATVDEILMLSGFRAQLPAIARSLGAEYLARLGTLDDRDGARVAQIIARHFAPDRMYAAVREEFRRRVEKSQLDAMAVWFRSPLALKITALEIAASAPDAAPKIDRFVAGIKTSPPPAARAELAQRLDWVIGTSEDVTDVSLAIAGSVERAAAAAVPAERRPRLGVVERGIEDMRIRTASVLREHIFGQMLYVYGPLTDAELKAYVDFAGSPAGRVFGRSVHGALVRVVRDIGDRTALDIVRAVPPQRWATAQPSVRSTTR
jgi:hypothetical protein